MCQQAYLLIFLLQSFHRLPQLLDGHAGPILPWLRTTHSTLYNNRQQHSLQQQTTTLPTADNSTPYNRQQHSLQQQTTLRPYTEPTSDLQRTPWLILPWLRTAHSTLQQQTHTTQTLRPTNGWQWTRWTDSPLAEDCPQHSATTNTHHSNPTANKRLTMDTLDQFSFGWGLPTTLQQQTHTTQTLRPTNGWQWTRWTNSPLAEDCPQHSTTTNTPLKPYGQQTADNGHAGPILLWLRTAHSTLQQGSDNTQTLRPTSDWQWTRWTDSPLAEDCPQHSTTRIRQHSNPTANKRLTMDTLDQFSPSLKTAHSTLYHNRQTTLKPYGQQATDNGHTGPILPFAEDCPQHTVQQQADNTQTLHWANKEPTPDTLDTVSPRLKTTHSTVYNLDQTTLKVKLCCSGPIPAGSTMGLLLCRYPPVRGNQQTCSPPQMKPALLLQHTIRRHCLNGWMCLKGGTL